MKGVWSLFKLIQYGIPQGLILGPILFNIVINNLIYILQSDLHNFDDDNTISAVADTLSELISSLTFKSGLAIDWFEYNSKIVNPDKFNAIILSKSKHDTAGILLTLGNQSIATQKSVTLLEVTVHCELSFDKHVSNLCKTAASIFHSFPATYHLALLMVCTFHSSLDMHDAAHTMMISDIATSAWLIDFCHKAI